MKLNYRSDGVMLLTDSGQLILSFEPNVIQGKKVIGVIECDEKTKYSKKMVCLRFKEELKEIEGLCVSRSKYQRGAFLMNCIKTSVTPFLVITFPGLFRYDRAIIGYRKACIEHTREITIKIDEEGDNSINILF